MENSKEQAKKKHGGARAGAGRPKGRKNNISIGDLLDQIKQQSKNREYEEILVEDFLRAREINDTQLMLKYHNLILNKVMNNLARIEITDSAEAVEAKKTAFAEALARITGVKQD